MSEVKKFSPSIEQEAAISATGHNVLVSAGAGSGKTAVLTERIYRLAKKDNSLDKFLVLTFTNLAANEMKDRTRGKLFNDIETRHLASEVDNAHIETFDSFCLYLSKKYFYELGISKRLSIVDQSILTIKRKMYLDELIEEECEKNNPKFDKLVSAYAIKNYDLIKDCVIALLEKADKKADNIAYINHLRDDFFKEDIVNSAVEELFNEKQKTIKYLISLAETLENPVDAETIIALLEELQECKSYDELRDACMNKSFPTKKGKGGEFTDGELRDFIRDLYKSDVNISGDKDFGSLEDIKNEYLSTKDLAEELIDLALEVEKRLNNFKKEKNAYAFGDISRFVLKLLQNENIRKEISLSFDYIMIDEYQDTNDIQDVVINAIARNNVYMVGDIKQSIYRFRGADCTIFQEKYDSYRYKKDDPNTKEEKIDLNTSYRSREEVVNFVNELFSQLMTKENNPIDYSKGHNFGFGNVSYNKKKPICSFAPEVYQYSYEKSAEIAPTESEIIANDILYRKKNGFQVFDKETGSRNCSFKDFAVIMDRGTNFDVYRKVFTEHGIPLKVESKEQLFSSDVALLVKNLVKMLNLSLRGQYDKEYRHCFLSIARSFLYNYKDDELHKWVVEEKILLAPFAQKMELIKESLRFASIKNVLETLYREYEIYENVSKIASYYANTHKMEHLLSLAGDMDSLGYTLDDFANYFDDLNKISLDIDYRDSDTQEDSVTLINIHGSKGLEYGIVYYPGLNVQFNTSDAKSSFLISDKYGFSIPSVEYDNHSILNSLIKKEIKKADIEEKIRLLYVAITRAKEKVILLRGDNGSDKKTMLISQVNSMAKLISLTDVFDRYNAKYPLTRLVVEDKVEKSDIKKITIKKIEVPAEKHVHNRASKEIGEEVNASLLDFGSELHAYLENMDLNSDSLEYIKDIRMRRYVKNVKNSSLFKEVRNEQVRHEYRFFDEKNNVEGYIDALIIKDNEVDIVDFKLKNIDDEAYDKQLRTYKRYIATLTNLPIKMYLLAAITGEIREVKDE